MIGNGCTAACTSRREIIPNADVSVCAPEQLSVGTCHFELTGKYLLLCKKIRYVNFAVRFVSVSVSVSVSVCVSVSVSVLRVN